jgi:signal transduction histidine kinase
MKRTLPRRIKASPLFVACSRFFDWLLRLLEIPSPEATHWFRRIAVMERDIMLPIKAAGIAMLYSFYFSNWISAVHNELDLGVEVVASFFWVYVGVNVVAAGLLLAMRRFPLGLIQWVVFASILMDGLFLSALTLVTGGYQSFLYWLFLGLIMRTAVSVPRATSQILLNLTIVACYVLSGVIEISIANNLEEHFRASAVIERLSRRVAVMRQHPELSVVNHDASTNLASHPRVLPRIPMDAETPKEDETPRGLLGFSSSGENATEPLFVRLVLLLLMTICSYSVQVLLERQRQVEEEARELGLREGQLRSAGRLAAEFAHQIKNPLAIINNAAYSLQKGLKEGRANGHEQIRIIQEEVEHSDRIIEQVMGYAQLTEGRVEKLNVTEELNAAVERVFPHGAEYPVHINRDYAMVFPPLLMQRRHFSESLINVLQNARDALNGKNGAVWITARCLRDYAIEVAIRDNGPGIPADKLERIFEPYYTTKEKGTGLGLATVKHNVELYGGTVRVESELGKGTTFSLLFSAKTNLKLSQKI